MQALEIIDSKDLERLNFFKHTWFIGYGIAIVFGITSLFYIAQFQSMKYAMSQVKTVADIQYRTVDTMERTTLLQESQAREVVMMGNYLKTRQEFVDKNRNMK